MAKVLSAAEIQEMIATLPVAKRGKKATPRFDAAIDMIRPNLLAARAGDTVASLDLSDELENEDGSVLDFHDADTRKAFYDTFERRLATYAPPGLVIKVRRNDSEPKVPIIAGLKNPRKSFRI